MTAHAPLDRSRRTTNPPASTVTSVLQWFDENARPLPWRCETRTPWGVLVSEVMLQQTPVHRVLPLWTAWMQRWPTPTDLAAAGADEVLRAWGRLGYPRRARWLHRSAQRIVTDYDGLVPDDETRLRTLPGVGEYTAAAVCAFAFDKPTLVLDTNVRRVISRVHDGRAAPLAHLTNPERTFAARLVEAAGDRGARWSAAVMELGAVVCQARRPECLRCPLIDACRWRALGFPDSGVPLRRTASYEGSDRQARGALLARLRDSTEPLSRDDLAGEWPDATQCERALASLIGDGLVHADAKGYRLGPGEPGSAEGIA